MYKYTYIFKIAWIKSIVGQPKKEHPIIFHHKIVTEKCDTYHLTKNSTYSKNANAIFGKSIVYKLVITETLIFKMLTPTFDLIFGLFRSKNNPEKKRIIKCTIRILLLKSLLGFEGPMFKNAYVKHS